MSKSKSERLASNGKLKNLSTEENKGLYGYISPINDRIMNPASYYWNTPVSYVPYPTYSYPQYYSPYDYQAIPSQYAVAPQRPTTPISKSPQNKSKERLPSAPKGRVPPEPYPSNASFLLTQPVPPIVYNPIQPPTVPNVPIQYVQAPAPQPQYYYPQASSSFYHRPPPSPYYHDRRRSPPPYYRDRYALPPISRRETFHERDYHDRYRRDRPVIRSYLTPRAGRWYH